MSTDISDLNPKGLPMIVDIALDTDGHNMYQIHESTKQTRAEMPLSTSFSKSLKSSSNEDLSSPSDSVLSTPSSSSKSTAPTPAGSMRSAEPRSCSTSNSDADIWCSDVQDAFEEALAMVPKNGLNKIKIGGKSCGRNELISDYIQAKTGKLRSRKQISSHIQVIKNMGLKKDLIALINEGPTFSTAEETEENNRLFEETFSKINMNKSLGGGALDSDRGSTPAVPTRRHSSAVLSSSPKRKKSSVSGTVIGVENISFSLESLSGGVNSIFLTVSEKKPMKTLTIKEDAEVSSRFPGLTEFSDTSVPILHNMVGVFSPLQLSSDYSIGSGLKTNYSLAFSGAHDSLSSFTTVYSFGNEVLNVNEDDFAVNKDQPFLLKFWKCFFLQLVQSPPSLDAAFKGTTVKQIVYDSTDGPSGVIAKNKVKAIILWEFSKVDDIRDAVSTASRLYLPPSLGYARMPLGASNYSLMPSLHNYSGEEYPVDSQSDSAQSLEPAMPELQPLPLTLEEDVYQNSNVYSATQPSFGFGPAQPPMSLMPQAEVDFQHQQFNFQPTGTFDVAPIKDESSHYAGSYYF